jgi:formate dehydrogenase maturation protein FdhE
MKRDKWEERIERAAALAAAHPFAVEGLTFYQRIASFQKSLYESLGAVSSRSRGGSDAPGRLREELAIFPLLPWLGSFLPYVADVAPPPLAAAATELSAAGPARWEEVLDDVWRGGDGGAEPTEPPTPAESLLGWAFLQPYAERLADAASGPDRANGGEEIAESEPEVRPTSPLCPACGAAPQVGVLRPLGDGAKRSLVCSLCATEWDYRRLVCPACGEEEVEKLPIYTAEALPYVRIEACDTCHRYLKTIDLTKNGLAVPVVDELAAIPLSLWAAEKGYEKLHPNLLGL